LIRTVLLFLSLSGAARSEDYALPKPPPGPRLDYAADQVEFDSDRQQLHLKGQVVIKESTWTVKGKELWIDTENRSGVSEGPLLVEDGISAVYGESGEFDFARHTGRLQRTSAGHADWRIHAREAKVGENRRLDYYGGDFTSCSAKPPHYHFRASTITVKPKKHMIARNVLFYLGDVPVFYMPFLYKSLSPRHYLRWKTQPGFDHRNGPFMKNTLTTDHGDTLYSKLYADYYMKQGVGLGGELHRRDGEDSRGALFGYTIKETSTGDRRWALLGQHYQTLFSSSSFQGRLQLQSDSDFNNNYARSNSLRVTPELVNGGAFTHRFAQATARLSYSRLDTATLDRRKFLKTTESYPRLDVISSPLRFGRLPWLNTLTGFADNTFVRGRPYIEKTVGGGWEGTRTFVLMRGVSLTPKLGYLETYYNRFDQVSVASSTVTTLDAVIGRPSAASTLRFDTPLGGIDMTQSYRERLQSGHFLQDRGAVDKGVEENLFTLTDVFIPAPRMYARLSSGYDFRTFRDRTIGFRQRVQPITADASWAPTSRLNLTVRDSYALDDGNQAAIMDARWGDDEGATVGGGFGWNAADSRKYVASLDFAVAPSSPTWRLAFGIRGQAESSRGVGGLHGWRVFEKEFSWTKRWHDFYTKVAGRFRPGGVGEASIRVDFKFGTFDPKQAPRRDWETELFPERATQDDLRP
jgi:LPS-assembly protein